MDTAEQLKKKVADFYRHKLQRAEGRSTSETPRGSGPVEVLGRMPAQVVSFGCGNPVALARLRPGDVMLDLGSGAGRDCFLAAHQVGPEGRVIGVDFTREMNERAGAASAGLHLTNVIFRLGDIEELPLDDASVDAVISNWVINLAPDKDAVFREAHRVLRPGGRMTISDIVLSRPATEEEQRDLALWAITLPGALPAAVYAGKVAAAGFEKVTLKIEHAAREDESWFGAAITALKPAVGPAIGCSTNQAAPLPT